MGRKPEATNTDGYGFLAVGVKEMLTALDNAIEAVNDGRIKATEYSFRFTTAEVKEQAGCLGRNMEGHASHWAELTAEMIFEVEEVFQKVEAGLLEEGSYKFEFTTEYFQYTSGHYPQQDEDEKEPADGMPPSGNDPPQDINETQPAFCLPLVSGHYPQQDEDEKEPADGMPPSGHYPQQDEDEKEPADGMPPNNLSELLRDSLTEYRFSLTKILLKGVSVLSTSWIKNKDGPKNFFSISITISCLLPAFAMVFPAAALAMTNHEQPLTLTAGKNGIVPFQCSNQQQFAPKYTTVKFEEKERPFYIDGILDPEGLMSPDQFERFTVEYYEDSSSMSIEISISSVSIEDQGTYHVVVFVQGTEPEYHSMKKTVLIIIPPGPAECFFMRSESLQNYYQIHCNCKPGNGKPTLACFQNGDKIPYLNNGNEPANQVVDRRIFWITDIDIPISCCSHDVKDISSITQDSCNQYRYPRIESISPPVPPANKIPTEILSYGPTKPFLGLLPTEEENGQFVTKSASHSGCTQNFIWPSLLLPAIIITYACTMNP